MSDTTRRQIGALSFTKRPLVICDVDEVVVHFTREFEDFLAERDLHLVPESLALNGNIRRRLDGKPITPEHVADLVELFFLERTLTMSPIEGAVESLLEIGQVADVVMLTNLPHEAGEHRRRNLQSLGLEYPVVTNSGPKGPAVKALASQTEAATVFIDDSPHFISSARQHAPQVHLVHFLHDERFARHAEMFDYLSLRTDNWREVRPHVLELIVR